LGAACLVVIVWIGLGWDTLTARYSYVGTRTEYYNLLVHGFLKGHLYLDVDPDPAAGRIIASLLDASYYKGHCYLYFGVTPAALILLPYAYLTGSDLDTRFIVVLSVALGFLFSLGIFRMAARDHGGRAGGAFDALATLALAFATAAPLLLTRSMFYEVPIAMGYALAMAGAFFTYRALSGRGATGAALALASLCMGLAVGCRPDLIVDVPIPAAAAVLIALRNQVTGRWGRSFASAVACALVPAGAVGIGLGVYNFERFGNPLEFGLAYSANEFIGNHHQLVSAAYLWPNLRWYYLTFPALSPFFPYVFPEQASFGPSGYVTGEAIHGQFPVFALTAFVFAAAILLRGNLRLERLRGFLGILGWMFASAFLLLCSIGVRADRYMVDFQPPLVLAIAILAAAVSASTGAPKLWRLSFGLLVAAAVAFNLFAALEEFSAFKYVRTGLYRRLEWIGNYPSYWLERAGILPTGPVEMKVVFPQGQKVGSAEPLLSVGTPERTDAIYANLLPPGGLVEIAASHHGDVGVATAPLPIEPGRVYTLKVDMGAFYPPLNHPYFERFNPTQAHAMKSRVRVEMDGVAVLNRRMNSFDAPPWTLEFGRNDITLTPAKTGFTGRVFGERRLAPPPPEPSVDRHGLWRIQCTFPRVSTGTGEPILAAGLPGRATLVYLKVLAADSVRFGLDEWATSAAQSAPIFARPGDIHLLEIIVGPLAANSWNTDGAINPERLQRLAGSLRIWLDGQLVWQTSLHAPFDALEAHTCLGSNSQGFSTAGSEYHGDMEPIPFSPSEAREFVLRNAAYSP
jgi:hypothetical protein